MHRKKNFRFIGIFPFSENYHHKKGDKLFSATTKEIKRSYCFFSFIRLYFTSGDGREPLVCTLQPLFYPGLCSKYILKLIPFTSFTKVLLIANSEKDSRNLDF